MPRTFLLGVGGHNCGTTWLHDDLSKSPQADMGVFKEYHAFDAQAERRVVDTCRETCDFIARRFGQDRMAALWHGYGLIG